MLILAANPRERRCAYRHEGKGDALSPRGRESSAGQSKGNGATVAISREREMSLSPRGQRRCDRHLKSNRAAPANPRMRSPRCAVCAIAQGRWWLENMLQRIYIINFIQFSKNTDTVVFCTWVATYIGNRTFDPVSGYDGGNNGSPRNVWAPFSQLQGCATC